jgi:hypothetical protein
MALGTGAFQAGTNYPGLLWDLLAQGGANSKTGQAHTSVACGGTSVYWTNSFKLNRGMTFGWEVALTSSGVCTVTIELEQGNQPPTTEGAADGSWVIPVGKSGANGLFPSGTIVAAATTYIVAYAPVATILGRLKITGTGSNDVSTTLSLARLYDIKNF